MPEGVRKFVHKFNRKISREGKYQSGYMEFGRTKLECMPLELQAGNG